MSTEELLSRLIVDLRRVETRLDRLEATLKGPTIGGVTFSPGFTPSPPASPEPYGGWTREKLEERYGDRAGRRDPPPPEPSEDEVNFLAEDLFPDFGPSDCREILTNLIDRGWTPPRKP